jgi:hypothetical protein
MPSSPVSLAAPSCCLAKMPLLTERTVRLSWRASIRLAKKKPRWSSCSLIPAGVSIHCSVLETNLFALGQVEFQDLFPEELPQVRQALIQAHTIPRIPT